MLLKSNRLLLVEEALQYLEPRLKRKISLSELYLFVLRGSLTISINLFEQVSAFQGRYIPFNKEKYDILPESNDRKKIDQWKWIDSNEIFFDDTKRKHYAFGKRRIQINDVLDLSMLGSETKHIESLFMLENKNEPININTGHVVLKKGNQLYKLLFTLPNDVLVSNQDRIDHLESEIRERLYDKRVDGFSTYYSMKAKPSEADIKEADHFRKELREAFKQPTKNPAKKYSALSDFSHILVIKKDNLDKLADSLQEKNQAKKAELTPKGGHSIKTMIEAFLLRQGINLNQSDAASKLAKLIVLNNFKFPDDAIDRCIKVLKHGTLSIPLLKTITEEELLIILSSLLHQEKPEEGKTLAKHIRSVLDSASPDEKTIQKYLDKISNIDRSKYRLISDDCLA